MQYGKYKSSKLTIVSGKSVSVSSSMYGANLDAVGFNLTLIAERRPKLAVEIMKLCREASAILPEDPQAPDEDFLAAEAQRQLQQVFARKL